MGLPDLVLVYHPHIRIHVVAPSSKDRLRDQEHVYRHLRDNDDYMLLFVEMEAKKNGTAHH